jgi:hypothetical protein
VEESSNSGIIVFESSQSLYGGESKDDATRNKRESMQVKLKKFTWRSMEESDVDVMWMWMWM